MAGGLTKYRHLSRKSSHRQALLRNIVDSLIEHESIETSWHKAKEAQRLAEKVITLGKKGTEASRRRAQSIFYVRVQSRFGQDAMDFFDIHMDANNELVQQRPNLLIPKLFTTLAARYADRPGGYTRVLRIEPLKEDQAPSAILELVDGPKDIRFAMTARTLARQRRENLPETNITRQNVAKVTRYVEDGMGKLERMAAWFQGSVEPEEEEGLVKVKAKRRVYPDRSQEKIAKARHTMN
jgi:large subunit ribosomal protein L17